MGLVGMLGTLHLPQKGTVSQKSKWAFYFFILNHFRGATVSYAGECTKDCGCITLWQPVCGENGKTYSNDCDAKCEYVLDR